MKKKYEKPILEVIDVFAEDTLAAGSPIQNFMVHGEEGNHPTYNEEITETKEQDWTFFAD